MDNEKKKIASIMKELSNFAFLGTIDENAPKIRPVSPIVDDEMNIWVATFSNSRKVKQIKNNNNICLAFVKYPSGDKSVIVSGKAEIIDDNEEKKKVWGISQYNFGEYFKSEDDENFCLIKIIPEVIEWWENWEQGRKIYKPD